MSESSLASLVGTTARRGRADSVAEPDEYQAFSFGRVGARAQLRIEFRKPDGYRLVLPYIDLKSIETADPDTGFVLQFVGRAIKVNGQKLLKCYQLLRDDRVAEIIEASRTLAMSIPDQQGVVTLLEIK